MPDSKVCIKTRRPGLTNRIALSRNVCVHFDTQDEVLSLTVTKVEGKSQSQAEQVSCTLGISRCVLLFSMQSHETLLTEVYNRNLHYRIHNSIIVYVSLQGQNKKTCIETNLHIFSEIMIWIALIEIWPQWTCFMLVILQLKLSNNIYIEGTVLQFWYMTGDVALIIAYLFPVLLCIILIVWPSKLFNKILICTQCFVFVLGKFNTNVSMLILVEFNF